MTMAGQWHAGQLRFHDFALLREAREARRKREAQHLQYSLSLGHRPTGLSLPSTLTFSSSPSSFQSRYFGNSPSSWSLGGGFLHTKSWTIPSIPSTPFTPSTPTIPSTASTPNTTQSRSFLNITNFQTTLHLKSLERTANAQPTNPQLQYEFLSALNEHHPEAVVERFENFKEFAVDERCALVYLQALQKCGMVGRFSLREFIKRLSGGSVGGVGGGTGTSTVSPETLEALQKLSVGKYGKAEMASRASKALSGGAAGVGGGMGGSSASFAGRGSSPTSPLFIQTYSPTKTHEILFTLARQVIVAFVVVSALMVVFTEKGIGGASAMLSGGKHIQEAEGSEVRFDDVKGVSEAKAELEEIVLYLKDPERFTRLGGKLPRGLLLTGPPGTGKTLLAKAIAGEAQVPFFFSSGSQFEEVYVGLGAKRIRELFEAAKEKSPAIIFIDEIDAVGGTRKLKDQSALKMTLNELLVQMDGFEENNGIIVIGATNFAESLDSALLRPGRFDKHVTVPLPDVGGRKEILEMYAAKTKLASDVDLSVLARGTTGFSGADLYNLMNQAAVKASVDGLESITMSVFEWAKDKILMGAERKSAVITPESARKTAYHEAGHAVVSVLTDGCDPIHKATIMPRGQSLGMVMSLPEGDQTSWSYKQMVAYMDQCMGGRVAEELAFGEENASSGASQDIKQATNVARNMVTKYGFSEDVGIVFYGGDTGQQDASGDTRKKIDDEVRKLTTASYERAKALLKKHAKEHKLLAETLLEYETLTGDEVRALVLQGKKPNRPVVRPSSTGGGMGDQSAVKSGKKKEEEKSGKSRIKGLLGGASQRGAKEG